MKLKKVNNSATKATAAAAAVAGMKVVNPRGKINQTHGCFFSLTLKIFFSIFIITFLFNKFVFIHIEFL